MTDHSEANLTSQIAYGNKMWGMALAHRKGQCGAKFRTSTMFTVGYKFGTPCTVNNKNEESVRSGAHSCSWSSMPSGVLRSLAGFLQSAVV